MHGVGWIISDNNTRDQGYTESYYAMWDFEFWEWEWMWETMSLRNDITLNEARAEPFRSYWGSDDEDVWTEVDHKNYNQNKLRMKASRPFDIEGSDRDFVLG